MAPKSLLESLFRDPTLSLISLIKNPGPLVKLMLVMEPGAQPDVERTMLQVPISTIVL